MVSAMTWASDAAHVTVCSAAWPLTWKVTVAPSTAPPPQSSSSTQMAHSPALSTSVESQTTPPISAVMVPPASWPPP
jgi:hypothetical protein